MSKMKTAIEMAKKDRAVIALFGREFDGASFDDEAASIQGRRVCVAAVRQVAVSEGLDLDEPRIDGAGGQVYDAMRQAAWAATHPTEEQMFALGAQLKAAREAQGLTVEQLGERMGHEATGSRPALERWEMGLASPSLRTLNKWAQALGLSLKATSYELT